MRLRGSAFWHDHGLLLEALVFILIGFSLRGVLERAGGFDAVVATMAAARPWRDRGHDPRALRLGVRQRRACRLLRRSGLQRRRPLGVAAGERARLGRDARRRHAGGRAEPARGDARAAT